jgi:hypothetical protein
MYPPDGHGCRLHDGTYKERVTLLVLHELTPERVTDPVNGRGKKAGVRRQGGSDGHHVCVVDGAGSQRAIRRSRATLKTVADG